jgi:hypothetical protein
MKRTLALVPVLLAVTLSGQDNWDQQVLYFQVK